MPRQHTEPATEALFVITHNYHPQTGVYTGQGKAFLDPLTPGEYMLPAYATFTAPPEFQDGKVRVWNGTAWVYQDAPPVSPPEEVNTTEELAASVRSVRNNLLAQTDWTQLPDVPISVTSEAAFNTYRQQLRDLPAQEGFPETVVWPTPPTYLKE